MVELNGTELTIEQVMAVARHKEQVRISEPAKQKIDRARAYVDEKLRERWSPEQISGRLKREYAGDDSMRVCHETIYQFIMSQGLLGIDYSPFLRQGHRRHTYGYRGKKKYKRIRNPKRIDERPAIVETRDRFGDWESDTVRGPQRQQVGLGTHVERKTRFMVIALLQNRSASTYNKAMIAAFAELPTGCIITCTVDNGMEFSRFSELERALSVDVYFANPYHSWERGVNENSNGLLRQYFPKGVDFSGVHPREVQEAATQLNNRPRKCLNYRTPAEAFKEELVAFGN